MVLLLLIAILVRMMVGLWLCWRRLSSSSRRMRLLLALLLLTIVGHASREWYEWIGEETQVVSVERLRLGTKGRALESTSDRPWLDGA